MSLSRLFAGLLLLPVVATGHAAGDSLADVLDRLRPGIVGIAVVAPLRAQPELLGTGFVIGDGRHVLTNAHVVDRVLDPRQREELIVLVGRGAQPGRRALEKIAMDELHDLALLRIDGDPLPALRLGDSSRVREGESYAFTGFPIGNVLGLYPATHRATISAITPIAAPLDRAGNLAPQVVARLRSPPFDIFQLDATAYPGNSGSPLFSPEDGNVVGILNMVFVKDSREAMIERPSGIAYALPIELARPMLTKANLR